MKQKKKQKKTNIQKDVVYGAHAIIEALKAKKRKLYGIYTHKSLPKSWFRIKPYLPRSVPNIQYVEKNVLDGIAQSPEHMGVVAVVSKFPQRSKMFDPTKNPFILLLDGIQDVRNLGAILRSAYCAGVDGVVLCKARSSGLYAPVFKASAGLAEHLDIHVSPSVQHAVFEIKKAGYPLYMAVTNGQNVTQLAIQKPCCLVIGNEAVGISKDVRGHGIPITIPQRNPEISYNASVAAGILLFHLGQQHT